MTARKRTALEGTADQQPAETSPPPSTPDATPEHDVVYVDLIKDEPLSRDEWAEKVGSTGTDRDSVVATDRAYAKYLDRFQPWHWNSKSEGNFEILGHGERYFNEADAEHNIRLNFGSNSIVYLRRAEHGNEILRWAYPLIQGENTQIGPECFAQTDGSVLNWRGVNYIPAPDPEAQA